MRGLVLSQQHYEWAGLKGRGMREWGKEGEGERPEVHVTGARQATAVHMLILATMYAASQPRPAPPTPFHPDPLHPLHMNVHLLQAQQGERISSRLHACYNSLHRTADAKTLSRCALL